jgi:hypothetical protein
MFNRILGVLKLDARTYEEIERDPAATSQAVIIVLIVGVLSAIGAGVGAGIGSGRFAGSFFGTLLWAFVGWLLWTVVSYFVGTALFGGRGTLGGLLRLIAACCA